MEQLQPGQTILKPTYEVGEQSTNEVLYVRTEDFALNNQGFNAFNKERIRLLISGFHLESYSPTEAVWTEKFDDNGESKLYLGAVDGHNRFVAIAFFQGLIRNKQLVENDLGLKSLNGENFKIAGFSDELINYCLEEFKTLCQSGINLIEQIASYEEILIQSKNIIGKEIGLDYVPIKNVTTRELKNPNITKGNTDRKYLTYTEYLKTLIEPTKQQAALASDRIAYHLEVAWKNQVGSAVAEKSGYSLFALLNDIETKKRIDSFQSNDPVVMERIRQHALTVLEILKDLNLKPADVKNSLLKLAISRSVELKDNSAVVEQVGGLLSSSELQNILTDASRRKGIEISFLKKGVLDLIIDKYPNINRGLQGTRRRSALPLSPQELLNQNLQFIIGVIKTSYLRYEDIVQVLQSSNPLNEYEIVKRVANKRNILHAFAKIRIQDGTDQEEWIKENLSEEKLKDPRIGDTLYRIFHDITFTEKIPSLGYAHAAENLNSLKTITENYRILLDNLELLKESRKLVLEGYVGIDRNILEGKIQFLQNSLEDFVNSVQSKAFVLESISFVKDRLAKNLDKVKRIIKEEQELSYVQDNIDYKIFATWDLNMSEKDIIVNTVIGLLKGRNLKAEPSTILQLALEIESSIRKAQEKNIKGGLSDNVIDDFLKRRLSYADLLKKLSEPVDFTFPLYPSSSSVDFPVQSKTNASKTYPDAARDAEKEKALIKERQAAEVVRRLKDLGIIIPDIKGNPEVIDALRNLLEQASGKKVKLED